MICNYEAGNVTGVREFQNDLPVSSLLSPFKFGSVVLLRELQFVWFLLNKGEPTILEGSSNKAPRAIHAACMT